MVNLLNDLIKNGKVQILEHKAVIENLLQSGYNKKSIYDVLVKKHHLNIKYRQFLNLVNEEILSTSSFRSNHKPSISSATQKPFNNDSAKIIAPTTDNQKTAKQALRDIQNDPNRTSLYD